ncbi:MAG: class I SAM-dependent methyltransferase [Candidatus Paceibacterota bacterium]|jgi:demethylmacrocin O-methyltransferase
MRTLDEIALSYNTDKSSMYHNYTKLYDLYFKQIQNEKLCILEIGIDKGYSLKTWKEYFPNSKIVGIDIIDLKQLEEDRIHILKGDQGDVKFLKEVNDTYGPFDIIIDDGSHLNSDMKCSFEFLFPLLKEGGLYIVEDLHACYWGPGFNTKEQVFIDTLKKLIDDVNSSGKSGVANIERDPEDGWYNQKRLPPMTWWEKNVEFLHLYRSIVFIKKYPPNIREFNSLDKDINYLTVGKVVPIKYHHSWIERMIIKKVRVLKRIARKIIK